jgi:hypothetical protein
VFLCTPIDVYKCVIMTVSTVIMHQNQNGFVAEGTRINSSRLPQFQLCLVALSLVVDLVCAGLVNYML